MGKKRLSYDFVYDKFKERGYTLLSTEYINSRELLKYLCPIHGEQQISYTSLQSGSGCKKCYHDSRKISYDTVKEAFEKCGYTLLSKEYIGSNIRLSYLCPSHGEQSIAYSNLCTGNRCPQCSYDNQKNII